MKKMRTMGLLLLAAIMMMTLIAGCSGETATTTAEAAPATEAQETEAATEAATEAEVTEAEETEADVTEEATEAEEPEAEDAKPKVALILEGAVSDMSWNATAYAGLEKIEALGAETKYVENIPASAGADAIRTFADEGFDVIFMSSNSYQDAGKEVAAEYPDVQFFMINSTVTEDNVRSFAIQDAEQGFLMGALAALLTESGTVGFIGGLPINPIINGGKGFEQGVKYVNEEVEVLSENTGNFDDVNAAKELAKAMIGQGADVLSPMANQASLGVMEAAEEEGKKGIGSGLNQETLAPNAAVVAIVKDTSIAYEAAYQAYLDQDMPETILPMGAAQGVVYIGDYYIDVDDEIKAQLEEIYEKLASGEITIDLD
ncbi:MAG TPA: BMP family ABC transporter substrate-binding protein [Clostridiaceae bacterium]|nr:BMP family ABC transporter substrate-binding protein [Clostridiaceae bacterium]